MKRLECVDGENAHRRTLIVQNVKQRPNRALIADLFERPRHLVVDICVFQQWDKNRDRPWIAKFTHQMGGMVAIFANLPFQGPVATSDSRVRTVGSVSLLVPIPSIPGTDRPRS